MVDIVVQNPDLSPKYVYASNDFFGNQSIIIRRDDYTPRDFGPNKIRRVSYSFFILQLKNGNFLWNFTKNHQIFIIIFTKNAQNCQFFSLKFIIFAKKIVV
jgi:hypothetical protein